MMIYGKEFPRLIRLIGVLVNPDFTEEEFKRLVTRQIEHHSELGPEIIRSFEEPDFSWMEILNHDEIGEVCDFETEEEAREFAVEMFLKPAMT